jgi:hypothetical protein
MNFCIIPIYRKKGRGKINLTQIAANIHFMKQQKEIYLSYPKMMFLPLKRPI